MKAIVVDDSKMMRTVEQRALESMGLGGLPGLATASRRSTSWRTWGCATRPGRWQMPEMDGILAGQADASRHPVGAGHHHHGLPPTP